MKQTSLLVLIFLICLPLSSVLAKDLNLVPRLEVRVSDLENKSAFYSKQLEENKNQIISFFELDKKRLQQEFKEKEFALERKFNEKTTKLIKEYEWITNVGIPATIIGLILMMGSIAGVWFKTREYIEKQVRAKIQQTLNDNRDVLIKLIRSQDKENKLKANSKLLLISKSDTDNSHFRQLFTRFGFSDFNVKCITYTLDQTEDYAKYDLIVFNQLEQENIAIELEKTEFYQPYLAYTNTGVTRLKINDHRLNYANSEFTLYHQTLNSLKFGALKGDFR